MKNIFPLILTFWLFPILLSVSPATSATANQWISVGPYGGQAVEIVIDPSNPATLYVGTPGAGVYKSTNGGQSWNQTNNGLITPGRTIPNILVLAIDPSNAVRRNSGTPRIAPNG
ncbi:MAG: hypothetical protein WCI11_21105 [Candidatus Methylumidiphilus sp.]